MKTKIKEVGKELKNTLGIKKLILILIVIFVVISLILCNTVFKKYSVGDTIKTDNIELTLTRAKLTKILYKGGQENSFLPPDNKKVSERGYKTADKNHMYVSFSVKVKNISNRPIILEDIFNDNKVIVKYKGTEYYTNASRDTSLKRCDKNCYKSGYVAWKDNKNNIQFKSFNYMSFNLKPKEEIKELRIYLDVPVELSSNKFKLIFELPKNNKDKQFIYKVK